MLRRLIFSFSILSLLLLQVPAHAEALKKSYDHSKWDAFLKKYVNAKGEVDFAAAHQDRSLLDEYVSQIEKVNEASFIEWPREEHIAYWINAYHAMAVKTVLDHYPVKSLQEIASAWDSRILKLRRESYSLNDIRNNELIKRFRDEKIHFALSTFSKSGPALLNEAYTGPKLEGQLYMAARRFVNDDEKNQIQPGGKKIFISKFFKWYGADFKFNFSNPDQDEKAGTREEFSILSFLAYYLEDTNKAEFLQEGHYKIKYLPFDWSLNAQESAPPAASA